MDWLIKWLSTLPNTQYWWWAVFVVFSAAVIFLASKAVSMLEVIAERTTIATAFIGGVLLSITTSLPELMSSIFSGINHHPEFGLSNVFGANMLTAAIVGVADLVFLKKFIFNKMSKGNKIMLWILVPLNLLMVIGMLTYDVSWMKIPGINISWLSLLPLFAFIGYTIWALKVKPEEDNDVAGDKARTVEFEKSQKELPTKKIAFSKWKMWQIWVGYAVLAGLLVFFAYNNATIVDKFTSASPAETAGWGNAHVYSIPITTGAGLILSLATSLPEITSIFILIRKDFINIAIGGILGSHIFNMALIGVTDLIDTTDGTFHEVFGGGSFDSKTLAWTISATFVTIILLLNTSKWKIAKFKRGPKVFLPQWAFKKSAKIEKTVELNKSKTYYIIETVILLSVYVGGYIITTFVV